MQKTTCTSLQLSNDFTCEQVPLRAGDEGVTDTVKDIVKYAKRDAKNPIVIKIAKSLRGSTDYYTVKNIFRYVRKNFPYKSDPKDVEFFTAPIHHLTKRFTKYCDCDDLTGILVCLFLASGLTAGIKVISWENPKKANPKDPAFTHVYSIVDVPSLGVSITADATHDELGKELYQPIIRSKIYKV